jgi:hypothetical protein
MELVYGTQSRNPTTNDKLRMPQNDAYMRTTPDICAAKLGKLVSSKAPPTIKLLKQNLIPLRGGASESHLGCLHRDDGK